MLGGLSPLALITIGLVLVALESLFFSFVFLWIGVACFIVSSITFMYVDIDLKWQISLIAIFSLSLLFLLEAENIAYPSTKEENN